VYTVSIKKLNSWFWTKYLIKSHVISNKLGDIVSQDTRLEIVLVDDTILVFPASKFIIKFHKDYLALKKEDGK
jgi:hypothetical protein